MCMCVCACPRARVGVLVCMYRVAGKSILFRGLFFGRETNSLEKNYARGKKCRTGGNFVARGKMYWFLEICLLLTAVFICLKKRKVFLNIFICGYF